MANKIPAKYRREVEERSGGRCELCGRQGKSIHHIIPRRKRIHRPETLIKLCSRHHRLGHGVLQKQLQVGLQTFYEWQGYELNKIRELMGGKIYVLENDLMKIVRLHFNRLEHNQN